MTDDDDEAWRDRLTAARAATTPAQDAWDRDWCRWHRVALRGGRGQLAAIEIAYTRTEARHGPRPEPEGGEPVTAEEWDTHWYRIKEDAVLSGMDERAAEAVADRETVEQFGSRPEEAA